MATRLTKKQQGELAEKLTGIIQKNNALQLRLSADRSVNEMNINQISGALNRIHGQAIGKDLPTEIIIPVKQLGSGDPSPDNIRPIVGYEIDGIGTIYGGELNIETSILTVTYGNVDLGTLSWGYVEGAEYVMFMSPPISNLANYAGWQGACAAYPIIRLPMPTLPDKAVSSTYTDGRIRIKDTSFNGDVAAFTAAMSGVMLVYELATPETYTLTPQQMLQLLDQL